MLTEEKLQNFLDDLRLGKYDTDQYKIFSNGHLVIKDLQNDTTLTVWVYSYTTEYWNKIVDWNKHGKIWKIFHKEPVLENYTEEYFCTSSINNNPVKISYFLYDSFETYRKELQEKDKLVERSNIQSSFGL